MKKKKKPDNLEKPSSIPKRTVPKLPKDHDK